MVRLAALCDSSDASIILTFVRLGTLYAAEALVALKKVSHVIPSMKSTAMTYHIKDGINRLQEHIAEEEERKISVGLDTAIDHSVTGRGEAKVLFVDSEESAADVELDHR